MQYKDLKGMTVKKLREEAHKFPDIVGAVGMKKDELVDAVAKAMGIEKPKDNKKKEAVKNKVQIKAELKKLKEDRAKALESKDSKQLKIVRFHVKRLRRELKKLTA